MPFPPASFTTPKLAPGEWCSQVHVACWEWNLTLSLNYISLLVSLSLGPFWSTNFRNSWEESCRQVAIPFITLFLISFITVYSSTSNFLLFFFCSNCTLCVSFGPTCPFPMYFCLRMITNNCTMESTSGYIENPSTNEIGQNSSMQPRVYYLDKGNAHTHTHT